jgi:hypothetical protein
MSIKPEWIITGVISGIAAGFIAYLAHFESGGTVTQPQTEDKDFLVYSGMNAHVMLQGLMGDNHPRHEWRRPDYDEENGAVIKMPVRYPKVSGQNINAVIHHGWDALNRPAPQDQAWFDCPPSDMVL